MSTGYKQTGYKQTNKKKKQSKQNVSPDEDAALFHRRDVASDDLAFL